MNRTAISHASASARATILACLHALCALCALGSLFAPAPARADDIQPPILAPLWYGSSVDLAAGIAHFSVGFDRRPDLLTVDAYARQADSFQFWTGTTARDPIADAYAALAGSVPLGTQSVISAADIPVSGKMTVAWPQDATYTGPRDSGGWGSVEGSSSYTLDAGNVVRFDVPLALMHASDGVFAYGFETFQYGGGGLVDYFGVSGRDYPVASVPEPAAPLLMGAGLLALAAVALRQASARTPARACARA